MIGSPNPRYFGYSASGSRPGPSVCSRRWRRTSPASGTTELTSVGGRSDHAAFAGVGIPIGGLFTGAEGLKTTAQAHVLGRMRSEAEQVWLIGSAAAISRFRGSHTP